MPDFGEFAGSVGGEFIKLEWSDLGLSKGLNKGPERINAKLATVLSYYAPQIESWMKSNAPWTDRTGAARNGLAARAYRAGDEHGIILYHQVPYGIYLETRFSGEYAIIIPAMDYWSPKVMDGAKNIMAEI